MQPNLSEELSRRAQAAIQDGRAKQAERSDNLDVIDQLFLEAREDWRRDTGCPEEEALWGYCDGMLKEVALERWQGVDDHLRAGRCSVCRAEVMQMVQSLWEAEALSNVIRVDLARLIFTMAAFAELRAERRRFLHPIGGIRFDSGELPEVRGAQAETAEFECEWFETLGPSPALIVAVRAKEDITGAAIVVETSQPSGTRKESEIALTRRCGIANFGHVAVTDVTTVSVATQDRPPAAAEAQLARTAVPRSDAPLTGEIQALIEARENLYPASMWYRQGEGLFQRLAGADPERERASYALVSSLPDSTLFDCLRELKEFVRTFGVEQRWQYLRQILEKRLVPPTPKRLG